MSIVKLAILQENDIYFRTVGTHKSNPNHTIWEDNKVFDNHLDKVTKRYYEHADYVKVKNIKNIKRGAAGALIGGAILGGAAYLHKKKDK